MLLQIESLESMKHIYSILIALVLVAGCDSEGLQNDDPPFDPGQISVGDYSEVDLEGDAFELRGARIEGRRLQLDVSYSGGCADHAFAGFTPETIITIYPPQLTVFVVHDGSNDDCEAWVSETVELELETLLDGFGDVFQLSVYPIDSHSDPITLHHNG